jgi:hypothetical protein
MKKEHAALRLPALRGQTAKYVVAKLLPLDLSRFWAKASLRILGKSTALANSSGERRGDGVASAVLRLDSGRRWRIASSAR